MKHEVYGIRDAKAQAFLPPFMSQNEATAIRSVAHLCMDENHQFNKSSEDYDLFHLANFDDESGKYELFDAPAHVVSCFQLKEGLDNG